MSDSLRDLAFEQSFILINYSLNYQKEEKKREYSQVPFVPINAICHLKTIPPKKIISA